MKFVDKIRNEMKIESRKLIKFDTGFRLETDTIQLNANINIL